MKALVLAALVSCNVAAYDCRDYLIGLYDYTAPPLNADEKDKDVHRGMGMFVNKALDANHDPDRISEFNRYALYSNDEDFINDVESTVLRLCIGSPDVGVDQVFSMAFMKEFNRFPFGDYE